VGQHTVKADGHTVGGHHVHPPGQRPDHPTDPVIPRPYGRTGRAD
jgi:hypothetical protein